MKIRSFEHLVMELGALVRDGWLDFYIRNELTGVMHKAVDDPNKSEAENILNCEPPIPDDIDCKHLKAFYQPRHNE